jgi:hypothetical protein
MSLNSVYVRASLLAILFMTLHLTDDVNRGEGAEGGFGGLLVVLIQVAWLYAIVRLAERRSGYVVSMIGSLGASFIAVGHLTGIGGDIVLGQIASASGPFFVWVVFAMAMTAIFSLICSVQLLFNPTTEKLAAPRQETVFSRSSGV